MNKKLEETPGRLIVEIPTGGGLLKLGTMPPLLGVGVPETDAVDWFDVHLRLKRRAGRVVGVICECASDARKLPGFEPLADPRTQ